MKTTKLLLIVVLAAMLIACFGGMALASTYDNCADALADMGLFQGSDKGFELDRIPTRAEAAAMLVRLLGAEAEAKEANYEHPFTDLKGWESPYVGYLYEKGLTKGVTETTFQPGEACSAQMFSTFILRALGYESGAEADFAYEDAMGFAYKMGVADIFTSGDFNDQFKRDNAVGLAYTALAAPVKADAEGNAPLLLQSLVDQGAVDAEKAAPYLEQFANYAALQKALASLEYDKVGLAMNFDMDYAIGITEGDVAEAVAMTMSSKIMMSGEPLSESFKMAVLSLLGMSMDGAEDGEAISEMLKLDIFAEGSMYYARIDMGEAGVQKYKLDVKALIEKLTAAMEEMSDDPMHIDLMDQIKEMYEAQVYAMPDDAYTGHYGIALLGPIIVETKDGLTTYRTDMTQLGDMIEDLSLQMSSALVPAEQAALLETVEIKINSLKADYVVDKDGKMTSFTMIIDMTQIVEGQQVSLLCTTAFDVVNTGAAVKVELPADLAEYVDILTMLENMEMPEVETEVEVVVEPAA